jgi:hypothetical protein
MDTPRTYVLTLNSPSRKSLRVWTGKSLHALRHCSVKQIDHTLMEIRSMWRICNEPSGPPRQADRIA